MLLSSIFWHIYIRSGQFLMPIDKVEITEDRFKYFLEEAINFYNAHCPLEDNIKIEVGTPRTYTFDSESHNYGIPAGISKVVPLRILGVNPTRMLSAYNQGFYRIGYSDEARQREYVPFEYRAPNLTVPYSGEYDVQAYYKYKIVEKEDSSTGEIYFEVPYLTTEERFFFDYLQGKFLIALGRSRRAFTVQEIPLEMDAEDLVAEGKEMVEEVKESIRNYQKSYLAFGG